MDGRSTGKLTSELNDFKVIRKKKNDVLNKLSITAKEDPIAQFHLGAIYYSGDGVEQNYEEAAKWFTKSAQQGHSQAQYNLAAMYEDGEGVKQNIDEALKWYKKSAEQGNKDAIEALKELGYEINDSLKQDTDKLYENSIITLQDNEDQGSMEESIDLYNLGIQEYNQKKFFKALNFFTKSAELGNSLAQYYLGRMYAEGQAVKQDIEEAKKWYKTSSLNGCEVAKKALKNIEINIKNNIPTVKQEKLTSKEDKNQGAVDLYNLGLQDYNQKRFFKALNSFTKSAELGNPLSQYYLGVMYSEGKAVKQDIEEAKKWFRKSSEQGNQDSLKALKKLSTEIKKEPVTSEEQYQFASDYYKEKIYSEAFKWFTKSAEQGNNNALYYLGIMYQKGEGVEKNLDEAKKYYKKSSLGGCLEAKTALDELENNIKDVSNINNTKKENVKKQQEESKKISQNKESVELYNLGVQDYKQKRFFKALNYFTKSAEMGNPLAQYYLGIMYAQGKSVKPDIGEAKKWFQKSSLSGCKEAQKALDKLESIKVKEPVNEKKEESQKVVSVSLKKDTLSSQEYKTKSDDTTALYSLAINYYNSKEPNYKEAFICFLQAAEKGNIKAQYNLAVMYEDGLGVPEDRQEAIKWYKKAAEQGDKDAIEALQELENLENQNDKEEAYALYSLAVQSHRDGNYAIAFNHFLKSAMLGYSEAQYNLAVMYEDGLGVLEDKQEAIKWYKKAAEQGNVEAKEALTELENGNITNYQQNNYINNDCSQQNNYVDINYNSNYINQQISTKNSFIKEKRNYWSAISQNPIKAYRQAFDKELPENNFDITKWEKKFNWGACLLGGGWVIWNWNFWIGLIFCIICNLLPICCIVGPTGLGMMIMFGNYPDWVNSILGFFAGSGCVCYFIIPVVVFVFCVWLGFYGNRIVYKTRPYRDLEHFENNQKMWAWLYFWLVILNIFLQVALRFALYASFGGFRGYY